MPSRLHSPRPPVRAEVIAGGILPMAGRPMAIPAGVPNDRLPMRWNRPGAL